MVSGVLACPNTPPQGLRKANFEVFYRYQQRSGVVSGKEYGVMFYDEHSKKHEDHREASLDLVGLVFLGVLISIPFVLYLIAQ